MTQIDKTKPVMVTGANEGVTEMVTHDHRAFHQQTIYQALHQKKCEHPLESR